MVSSNCSCCFSKVGFSYYMVKKWWKKSCVNYDVYFFGVPTIQCESIFYSEGGKTLHGMGSKLGVGDIGEWFLISLQASHPCPRRPKQGLYRHLPATTPGHCQSHQVFGMLINYSFKSMWQFNSTWPAIALWFQVPGHGMEEPAGLSSMHCDFNLLGLISILDECSYVSNWLLQSSPVAKCLFWKSRSRRSHLYLLCLYHFREGQKGAHKVLQVNSQIFFSLVEGLTPSVSVLKFFLLTAEICEGKLVQVWPSFHFLIIKWPSFPAFPLPCS